MTNPLLERSMPSRVTRMIGGRVDSWTGSPFVQARLGKTPERAESWWTEHAPHRASTRPVADVLLSHEARPARVIRQARS